LAGCCVLKVLFVFQYFNLFSIVSLGSTVVDIVCPEELRDDQSIHPSEQAPENDEATNNFSEELTDFPKVNGISSFTEDTEAHMKDAKDDCHLHLDTVDEIELVFGEAPNRILSKWIDTFISSPSKSTFFNLLGDLLSFTILADCEQVDVFPFVHVVARAEEVGCDCKILIVDEACVERSKAHHEKQVSSWKQCTNCRILQALSIKN